MTSLYGVGTPTIDRKSFTAEFFGVVLLYFLMTVFMQIMTLWRLGVIKAIGSQHHY
jgi:hypothetical protein